MKRLHEMLKSELLDIALSQLSSRYRNRADEAQGLACLGCFNIPPEAIFFRITTVKRGQLGRRHTYIAVYEVRQPADADQRYRIVAVVRPDVPWARWNPLSDWCDIEVRIAMERWVPHLQRRAQAKLSGQTINERVLRG